MITEIERKFLVDHEKLDFDSIKCDPIFRQRLEIKQSFMVSQPDISVRARITTSPDGINLSGEIPINCKLCVKIGVGPVRREFEQSIPFTEAIDLLELYPMIHKMRYVFHIKGSTRRWEVDQFFGKHEGLWLAEIELDSLDEEIKLPDWIGKEVTWDAEYYNCNLATE